MKRVVIRKPWGWEVLLIQDHALLRPEDFVVAMFAAWANRVDDRMRCNFYNVGVDTESNPDTDARSAGG